MEKRILIVEDNELNMKLFNDLLQAHGYKTVQTRSGVEAVELARLHKPDLILIQGDTTTTFCAALAAFYRRIPVGHVEAGLRTWDLQAPWPEEANRVLASRITTLHFAPTETSRQNLLREGIPDESIFVTGNTGIDALFVALKRVHAAAPEVAGLASNLQPGKTASGAPYTSQGSY